MWQQLVTPNLEQTGEPGVCLGMQQRVWGAPGLYNTAWEAWTHTQFKHEDRNLPDNIAVPIWFDHWGTYDGVYGQYGHVATYVPGRGVLSNPGRGVGQKWYDTIDQCARDCNATYVGWTEDINSVKVAQFIPDNNSQKDNHMIVKVQCTDGFAAVWNMTTGKYQHIDQANEWEYWTAHLQEFQFENEAHFVSIRDKYKKVFSI